MFMCYVYKSVHKETEISVCAVLYFVTLYIKMVLLNTYTSKHNTIIYEGQTMYKNRKILKTISTHCEKIQRGYVYHPSK